MNIELTPFFYYSYEFEIDQLPVKCRFIRYLYINENREQQAILAETERLLDHLVYGGTASRLVFFPKSNQKFASVPDANFFPVFVFVADERIKGDSFYLPDGYTNVADWGAICFSEEYAQRNQVKGPTKILPPPTNVRSRDAK